MHYIISIFQYTLGRKNFKLFLAIFASVFVIVTYFGKVVVNEFDRIKDNFLENLSSSINKKISIGPITGDYLYNINIKNVRVLNRNDNTVYVDIPSLDVKYNILKILLDSKNGLKYINTVNIKDFTIYLRDGLFKSPDVSQSLPAKKDKNKQGAIEKIEYLKVNLTNGTIHRYLWGGRYLIIKNVNANISKLKSRITLNLSGNIRFFDGTKLLRANISLYAYKSDKEAFSAGIVKLTDVKYSAFHIKNAMIGITVTDKKIKFSTLKKGESDVLAEKIFGYITGANTNYDVIPNLSGEYNIEKKTLSAKIDLGSASNTINKAFKYYVKQNVAFKWGFHPQGSVNISYDFKSKSLKYDAGLSFSNAFTLKDRLFIHLVGNEKKLLFTKISYEGKLGKISGQGSYTYGQTVPELKLFADDIALPIGGGIEVSAFISTTQTGVGTFDLVLEDIDAASYYKPYLKFSFTVTNRAISVTSNTIINEKLVLNITLPKHGGAKAELLFNEISLDDIKNAISPKYLAEPVIDNEDRDRYIVNGSIKAAAGGASGYSVEGNLNILNDEIRSKYLAKVIFTFEKARLTLKKLNFLNGDMVLKGIVDFEDIYIFPVIKGRYKQWPIDLSLRLINSKNLGIEGMLNHSLNFRGELVKNKLKMFFDLDEFIFKIARKPIMLSDSFMLIFHDGVKYIEGAGTVIWHNIGIFEGKKSGVWLRFTLNHNVLTAHEAVFFNSFSSKDPLNLEAGTPGYGKVTIDPEYARVIVEGTELNNSWKAKVSYGFSSDLLDILMEFYKPFDFSKVDDKFYYRFVDGISKGKVKGGYIHATGPSLDIKLKARLVVEDGMWRGIPFSGVARFYLYDNILTMPEVHIENNSGKITINNLILAMDASWQIDFSAKYNLKIAGNKLIGNLKFASSREANNNNVIINATDIVLNNAKISNIGLKLVTTNMRFHDFDREDWSIKIESIKSKAFTGYISRKNSMFNVDMAYLVDDRRFIALNGDIKNKNFNLKLYSSPLDISFINRLATGLQGVDGKMQFNIALKGTFKDPLFYGYLNISDASFYISGFRKKFKNTYAYFNFNERRINIKNITSENGSEVIAAKGIVDFTNLSRPEMYINFRTTKNRGIEIDLSEGMVNTKGKITFDFSLSGENGINTLKGKVNIFDNIIMISPISLRVPQKKKKLDNEFLNRLGIDIALEFGESVDLKLNPEVLEMRILKGGKLKVKKTPGLYNKIVLIGSVESRKGTLRAYNSAFEIYYAKIEFKNEKLVLGDARDTRRVNKIYLALNSRTQIKDENDNRSDVYLDFNGEVNADILNNFGEHLVLKSSLGRSKREILTLLGSEGEGLSFLLSPVLNVLRNQLGFVDKIEGRTEAATNVSKKRRTSELSQNTNRRINIMHNTEIKVGKYLNVSGLFNNNLYLEYGYVFKQDPMGNNVKGYHTLGLDWTFYSFENGNMKLKFNYTPYDVGIKYNYQPKALFVTNFRF